MALNEKTPGGFTTTFGTTNAAAAPQPEQVNDAFADYGNWTMSDPTDTGPVSANSGSEDLRDLAQKIEKKFEQQSNAKYKNFILLEDKQTTNYFSSIVVACVHQDLPNVAAYHIFPLEATNSEIPDQVEQFASETSKIKMPSEVVYNDDFVANIDAWLKQALPQYTLVQAGATLIPRTFNKENDTLVHKLAWNASFAISTAISTMGSGFRDFSLMRARGDTSLAIQAKFEPQQHENAVGLPIRSDFQVEFLTEAARRGNNTPNESWNSGKRQQQSFGTVGGFVDAVWNPSNPAAAGNWGQPAPQTNTQTFSARVVITELNPAKLGTIGAVLTLMNSITVLSVNDMWTNAFRRDPTKLSRGGVDWKDVGALNIEANIERDASGVGRRVDTDPMTMTDDQFRVYISSIFHQVPFYSIDVAALSPVSWALDMLRAAALGDSVAASNIIAAANDLTEGEFSKHYRGEQPMFVETNNMIHLGYYEGADGRLRDIRDIDQLAINNQLGERDGGVGLRWSNTFYNTTKSLNNRLSTRWELIEAMAPSAKLTGFAYRITPSNEFLAALGSASYAAGLRTRLIAPNTNMSLQNNRAVAGFVNQAVYGNQSGVFNAPGIAGVVNNGGNPYGNVYNRHGR